MKKSLKTLLIVGIFVSLLLSVLSVALAALWDQRFLAALFGPIVFFFFLWAARRSDRFLREHGYFDLTVPGHGRDWLLLFLNLFSAEGKYPTVAAYIALSALGCSILLTVGMVLRVLLQGGSPL